MNAVEDRRIEGSYAVSRFAVDSAREIQRLKAQVDLFWKQELTLYQRLGLADGMRVLDGGCGPGYLLEKLNSTYSGLECTGVEIDPTLVQLAAQAVQERQLTRCSILQQSVTRMELPDNHFDFAILRLVLEHLVNPALALQHVLRVLKPGGVAVFIDNDFEFHERTSPSSPTLDLLYEAYRLARRAEGGNPCIGRELPSLLKQSGFGEVDLQVLVAHNHIVGDTVFQRAEGSGIPAQLVRTGFLAPEALEDVSREWLAALTTEDHSICRILFAGIGRKVKASDTATTGAAADRFHAGPQVIPSISPGSLSRDELMVFMQSVLAAEMDMPPEEIPLQDSLVAAGVDSLGALGLCNKLKSRFGVSVDVAGILSGRTIADLAAEVLLQLRRQTEVPGTTIHALPRASAAGL